MCLKRNFSEGHVWDGRGGEGCLQGAWLSACTGRAWKEAAPSLIASSELLLLLQPKQLPFLAWCPHSSLALLISFHDPCSLFPFCPAGLQLLLEIIFFNTISICPLNPAGAIVGHFQVSLFLSNSHPPARYRHVRASLLTLSFVQTLHCKLFKLPAIFLIK